MSTLLFAGDVPSADAFNTLVRALLENYAQAATVTTSETFTSTAFTDIAGGTAGPAVTVTSKGSRALAIWSAQLSNDTAGGNGVLMSVAVTGASGIAANDAWCLSATVSSAGSSAGVRASAVALFPITPGVNTYTCKYRTIAGTGRAAVRDLLVIAP